jgi:Uma2 family endonuclease
MVMPARNAVDWTVEMRDALPDDGNRYEVIDGELLVTPAPAWRHQYAVGELLELLSPFVTAHALGRVIHARADVVFTPRRAVQPDVFVVPLVDGRSPRDWSAVRRMLLAVEVLSPSTGLADRQKKRVLYQDEGVPEYWIVDLDARLFERWRPGDTRPEILTDTIEWKPTDAHPALLIELPEYFARVDDT